MSDPTLSIVGAWLSVWAVPSIIAITLHEAAHGYVAWKLGDDTAYRMGRISFNPIRHIDRFGTIILPLLLLIASNGRMLFGWAKPVPVNFGRLHHPRRDMVWVAAAGPAMNIGLALISGFLIHLAMIVPGTLGEWIGQNLQNSIAINVVLAVFNMFPLPPLDGGRVAVGLLPRQLARPLAGLERWGLFLVIALLFILPMLGHAIGVNLNIFGWLMGGPGQALIHVIEKLTGLG